MVLGAGAVAAAVTKAVEAEEAAADDEVVAEVAALEQTVSEVMAEQEVAQLEERMKQGFVEVEVLRNKPLGDNTRLVRLKLHDDKQRVRYDVGSYVLVKGLSFHVDESFPFGKFVLKPYLAVQPPDREGHFDLIVKTYPFPKGSASRYLAEMRRGDRLEVKGPFHRPEVGVVLRERARQGGKIAVLTGGAGMVAGLQAARSLLHDTDASIVLLASDKGPADLFYVKELSKMEEQFPGRFAVHRTLTRDATPDWDNRVGRVSKDMLEDVFGGSPEQVASHTFVLCGPPAFVQHLGGQNVAPNKPFEQLPAACPSSTSRTTAASGGEPHGLGRGLLVELGVPKSSILVL
ncbi:NADH-cytochrome b5 reductase 2 (Mitochondrial cytochrome b reductase) [Durusdinium trenchii]|uniref:NADH-cytochrome b5 reductase 2 (Mitochondrial cytochrome b reductase) n=1 Tax=Durusdinium trenchii TaxID=1381693 RepID=A0ABP0M7U9_9DINO